MLARSIVNAISLALGVGFTLSLFLSIAHFLQVEESAAEVPVSFDDLETVMLLAPPPPPAARTEGTPPEIPDLSEAIALGLAEEPSSSPVKLAPSPPSIEELLPMVPPVTPVVAGAVNLESTFRPTMDVDFDETRVFQKDEVDQRPFVISRSEPSVPISLLGEGRQRSMVLLFIVDTRGAVGNIRILQSSNNAEFDSIVVESIRDWVFSPAVKQGKQVRCMIQQQITVQMGQRDRFSL